MMRTTIEVFGARVRQARILRRMTGKTVLAEMGWKGARQTRLEQADVTVLDVDTATRLAEVLRFPLEFFATAPVSRVDVGNLLFRAPKATSAMEREYLAQFAVSVGDLLEDLNSRWQLPPVKLPDLTRLTDPVAAARTTRERLSLDPDAPIGYLTYEVERAGVAVVLRARRTKSSGELEWGPGDGVREKHLGYATRVGEYGDRPLIVLRAVDSWERIRWTVAHELGHLVLHADGVREDEQEEQASRFASELLAPAAVIAAEVPKVASLHNLMPLKQRWGISLGALLRHLFESELIDAHRYAMLRRQLYTRINPETGHTWGRTEPGWDEREPEQPRLLAKWVERCYNATSPAMLAPRRLIWPQDLLEDILAGQRSAPSTSVTTPPKSTSSTPTNASTGAPPSGAAGWEHGSRSSAENSIPVSANGGKVLDFDRFRSKRQA
ncbi:helix-turn-helix domain-containing protein [Pseudonocardia sp. TRM90224]|uniref:helix-turn-helix domain-containing protein n=1 Tax=Pseudonocardia sp. TRM90224 TaxID=2812678 RepID=UPI001E4F5AC4|nr:ImmA/IrrE family metallo-endopeptidase [Pseudonocardia sp. TRM90224]